MPLARHSSTQSFPSGRRGGLAVCEDDWCQSRAKWRRNKTHSAQLGEVNERHADKEMCALGVAPLQPMQHWTSEGIENLIPKFNSKIKFQEFILELNFKIQDDI